MVSGRKALDSWCRGLQRVRRGLRWFLRVIGICRKATGNINTSDYWDKIWMEEGLETRNNGPLHDFVIGLVPEGAAVIDLGCGNGQLLRKLEHRKACAGTGVDISGVILRQLEKEGIRTRQAVLPRTGLPAGSCDVALCCETLEHLDAPLETVEEMFRLVRRKGLMIVAVPDGSVWGRGGEHVHALTAADCVNALRPYVEQVNLVALNSHGYPHLICWGEVTLEPARYEEKFFAEVNRDIRSRFEEGDRKRSVQSRQ